MLFNRTGRLLGWSEKMAISDWPDQEDLARSELYGFLWRHSRLDRAFRLSPPGLHDRRLGEPLLGGL